MREKRGESATVSAYVDNLAESDGLPWLQNTKRRCSMKDNQKQTHTLIGEGEGWTHTHNWVRL